MIVLDTGGLYAALDANEELHGRCAAAPRPFAIRLGGIGLPDPRKSGA